MSTIDIGASENTPSRSNSQRANASPVSTPVSQEMDTGDFYIGSTKISALATHSAAPSTRLTPAN